MSFVLVASTAWAVDLGQQRVVRRDMQAVADMAALDLARHLNGQKISTYTLTDLDDELATALQRNGTTLGDVLTTSGRCAGSGVPAGGPIVNLDAVQSGACWRFVRQNAGSWTPVWASTATPDAVQVLAKSKQKYAFVASSSGSATRKAVASSDDASVCVSVGTKALTLDTSKSALSPLLDNALGGLLKVDLDVIGYDGIVDLKNVSVPLVGLFTELGIGTAQELADANVSLASLTLAAAKALEANGSAAAADVLEAISLEAKDVTVKLADILSLEAGEEPAGLNADINALDLLGVAAVAANGKHALEAQIPDLLEVTVIEPPQIACGKKGVEAHSAQIRLNIKNQNLLFLLNNAGLTAPGYLLNGTLKMGIEIAGATATVDSLQCEEPVGVTVDYDTGAVFINPGQLHLGITPARFLNVLDPLFQLLGWWLVPPLPPLVPGVPGVGQILKNTLTGLLNVVGEVGIDADLIGVGVGQTTGSETLVYPEAPGLPEPLVVPEGGTGDVLRLEGANVQLTPGQSIIGVLAANLNWVLSALTNDIVSPLISNTLNPLLSGLLNPVLNALGIKLGVAEVSVSGRPMCNAVKLVG